MSVKFRLFCIYANSDKGKDVATLALTADTITGAEQDIVLLGKDGKAVAVIELQPGFDRREIIP